MFKDNVNGDLCGGGFGPGRNWASYDILGQAKGGVFSFTGHRAGRASAWTRSGRWKPKRSFNRNAAGPGYRAGLPLLHLYPSRED